MKIIGIETSCDETAISIVSFDSSSCFKVLSDTTLSQIKLHQKYGGVYPSLAKREHIKNLYPVLLSSLKKAGFLKKRKKREKIGKELFYVLSKVLDRDPHNLRNIVELYQKYQAPPIDKVAVTSGPGLEIALWAGFNFAKSLSMIWKKQMLPINHMEGHIYSALMKKEGSHWRVAKIKYPSLALLISGGHTELVLLKGKSQYQIIGMTLDDAVGEAYDKTARLLKIPYPGGPEISRLAEIGKKDKSSESLALPRPMISSPNLDFSFSGLKTAVLLLVQKKKRITLSFKKALSLEFEDAVAEVLTSKSQKAIRKFKVKNLIIGGGVSANRNLRKKFKKMAKEEKIEIHLPDLKYSGDNALMIAVAAYYNLKDKKIGSSKKVSGNLRLK